MESRKLKSSDGVLSPSNDGWDGTVTTEDSARSEKVKDDEAPNVSVIDSIKTSNRKPELSEQTAEPPQAESTSERSHTSLASIQSLFPDPALSAALFQRTQSLQGNAPISVQRMNSYLPQGLNQIGTPLVGMSPGYYGAMLVPRPPPDAFQSIPLSDPGLIMDSRGTSLPQALQQQQYTQTNEAVARACHMLGQPTVAMHVAQAGMVGTTSSPMSFGTGHVLPPSRRTIALYMACDDGALSDYQCLVRKNIELFAATREDTEAGAQGRNKAIVEHQVGIRCIHCAPLHPRQRARGAAYYPSKLEGLYQAAQNMASSHFGRHCNNLPDEVRDQLFFLHDRKSSAGGGKHYWADGAKAMGIVEDPDGGGLRYVEDLDTNN